MSKTTTISGINIQWPWSQLIIKGEKTVETRSYPISAKHLGQPLALIETPGPRGKKEAGIDKARIIGIVVFTRCFQYKNSREWRADFTRHRVPIIDSHYRFSKDRPKWGWEIRTVQVFQQPLSAPLKRGIIYATACQVPLI